MIQQHLCNPEEVENSLSLDLSFSTQNVRTRTLSEIRKAAAKISKVKLQLVPQPLIQLITSLCSRMYQLILCMLRCDSKLSYKKTTVYP